MEQSESSALADKGMQVYGRLVTELNKTLEEIRGALAAHSGLLPEGRLKALDTLLAEFADRRIRVAFYGEVKAGKSTLINAVAGQELSPVAYGPLTSVPVRVTWGKQNSWRVGEHRFDNISALYEVMKEVPEDAREVVVETSADLLQLGGQVDLIDTPGVGSEDRFDHISAEALQSLDTVVLVVRYPGLFTKFTRHLMNELQNDIGKLFVVWNLETSCAELSDDEMERHAEILRKQVAGANELHLVDAREGFRAAKAGDQNKLRASGLVDFNAALRGFASSEKGEVAALREAAKRGKFWLSEAHQVLNRRRAALEETLKTTREWLADAKRRSDAETESARKSFSAFQSEIAAAESERKTAAENLADRLRKQIRSARRSWVFSADQQELERSIRSAVESYADDVDAACRNYVNRLQDSGDRFGAAVPLTPKPRTVPLPEPLVAEDRIGMATRGRGQLIKRMLLFSWCLPGVSELKGPRISEDLASQADWAKKMAESAELAARAVLDQRLADTAKRSQEEIEEIKERTRYDAEAAEMEALHKHVPMVDEARNRVIRINREARALFG